MKKKLTITLVLILALVFVGVAAAAFGDRSTILGSSFSVGSADIKLLEDLAGGTSSDNLVDKLNVPSFQQYRSQLVSKLSVENI